MRDVTFTCDGCGLVVVDHMKCGYEYAAYLKPLGHIEACKDCHIHAMQLLLLANKSPYAPQEIKNQS